MFSPTRPTSMALIPFESVSRALIPYTPPQTPMEFIRSEVERGLNKGGFPKSKPQVLEDLAVHILRFLPPETTRHVNRRWNKLTKIAAKMNIEEEELPSIKSFAEFLIKNEDLNKKLPEAQKEELSKISQSAVSDPKKPLALAMLKPPAIALRKSILDILKTLADEDLDKLKLSAPQPMPTFFADIFESIEAYKLATQEALYRLEAQQLAEDHPHLGAILLRIRLDIERLDAPQQERSLLNFARALAEQQVCTRVIFSL